MRFPSLILVLPLSGCHLFASGDIECTIQGPPSCFEVDDSGGETADTDTDSGGETLELERGLVLSFSAESAWWAQAFAPPSWSAGAPALSRSGDDDNPLLGPADYDEDGSSIYVASSEGKLYRLFSADASPPTQTFPLGDREVKDVAVAEGVAWLAGGASLARLDPESGAGVEEVPFVDGDGTTLSFASVGPIEAGSQGVAAVVGDASGNYDLVTLEPADRVEAIVTTVVADDFTTAGQVDAVDLFRGPEDEPWICDRTGHLFAIATLAGGGLDPDVSPDRSEDSNVLACGWDDSLESFLIVSAEGGVFAVDGAGGVSALLEPDAEGYEIHGAGLF